MREIVAADDGKEPWEKSRHNFTDPTNDEIMAFVVDYMDGTDQRLLDLEKHVQLIKDQISEVAKLAASLYTFKF